MLILKYLFTKLRKNKDTIIYSISIALNILFLFLIYLLQNENLNIKDEVMKQNNYQQSKENYKYLSSKLLNKNIKEFYSINYAQKEKNKFTLDSGFVIVSSLYGCNDCVEYNLNYISKSDMNNYKIIYLFITDDLSKIQKYIKEYKLVNVYYDNKNYFDECYDLFDRKYNPLILTIKNDKIISYSESFIGDKSIYDLEIYSLLFL